MRPTENESREGPSCIFFVFVHEIDMQMDDGSDTQLTADIMVYINHKCKNLFCLYTVTQTSTDFAKAEIFYRTFGLVKSNIAPDRIKICRTEKFKWNFDK